MTPEEIASVCHEANRQLTRILQDVPVQPAWDDEDAGIRASALNGVQFVLNNPALPPSASHENWLAQKQQDGWVWGPAKDLAKKTHPAMVPYAELPRDVQLKDALFQAVVKALTR